MLVRREDYCIRSVMNYILLFDSMPLQLASDFQDSTYIVEPVIIMAIETECNADRTYIVGEDTLLEALKEMMRRTAGPATSPLPPASCIFNVPEALWMHNPKAYEPYVVSIGPFHRGRDHEKLQRMETVKQWYLDTLLVRVHISSQEFIQRINDETENGIIEFEKRCLYRLTLGKIYGGPPFNVVLTQAFRSQNSLEKFIDSYLQSLKKTGQNKESLKKTEESNEKAALHILDLIRFFIVLEFEPKKGESEEELESDIPPATALSEAGVKFKKGDSADNLLNIKFDNRDLTIPELAVAELTEPFLRNLIAFEQCYHGRSHQITSYAVFMDKLISSDKDIKLLSEKKILANWLNVEDGSKFFNSLYIDTSVKDFQYHKLCVEVNKYYHVKWNRYFEQFRRDYCSTPWKVIALAVGILLLLVNLMQLVISLQILNTFYGYKGQ
ncbi:unnamed protein product [Prunus armeniaca]